MFGEAIAAKATVSPASVELHLQKHRADPMAAASAAPQQLDGKNKEALDKKAEQDQAAADSRAELAADNIKMQDTAREALAGSSEERCRLLVLDLRQRLSPNELSVLQVLLTSSMRDAQWPDDVPMSVMDSLPVETAPALARVLKTVDTAEWKLLRRLLRKSTSIGELRATVGWPKLGAAASMKEAADKLEEERVKGGGIDLRRTMSERYGASRGLDDEKKKTKEAPTTASLIDLGEEEEEKTATPAEADTSSGSATQGTSSGGGLARTSSAAPVLLRQSWEFEGPASSTSRSIPNIATLTEEDPEEGVSLKKRE